MATPAGTNQSLPAVQPSWLARNWMWALLLGLLGLMLLFALFAGGIFLILETSFQHSDFYPVALARARANPQVIEKIGQPITAGWMATGSVNISGPTGKADIAIPISGPTGKGTLYVVARKSTGLWKFEALQVAVAGQSERIDLLAAESNPEPEAQ